MFMHADSQSSGFLRSTCPNHLNLSCLITSETLSMLNRLNSFAFTVLPTNRCVQLVYRKTANSNLPVLRIALHLLWIHLILLIVLVLQTIIEHRTTSTYGVALVIRAVYSYSSNKQLLASVERFLLYHFGLVTACDTIVLDLCGTVNGAINITYVNLTYQLPTL